MERTYRDYFSGLHRNFHEVLSRIQARSFKTKPDLETLRTTRGVTLLFFAIGLAWASLEITQTHSIEMYRNQHWPALSTWEQTLKAHGLSRRIDLSQYGKLLEKHPAPFEAQSYIWTSSNECIVYLSQSPFHSGGELWTCEPGDKVNEWKKLGTGLTGYEALVKILEESPKKALIVSKAAPKFVDPKEFHY